MRITVACPESLIEDANHLAMVLAHGPADGQTYGAPGWVDAAGHRYACASFEARAAWIAAAQGPIARPAWDDKTTGRYIVNMAAAARAQAALVLAPAPAPAAPDTITALAGPTGPDALAAMGLSAPVTET
ncbi:hypothetical protein [Phaeovulum vinaykumarii]|uniref:Uncharacterized protein n=1 Tax=Phaeovulum vinaykumarii TaxID=407234 RepID=A0A1N7MFC1_9RHOB|nr:hypothetical protein [Phaeovulum vinaykumarii]SIS84826.1 hypothetical protein SAMN05421795_10757 [Phaeovulum vinaykumarii]SOC11960.1 hypothetical protein SAMN05878426_10757 [Phaeovulum vinaykumarii]